MAISSSPISNRSKHSLRLTGIDLLRGVAVFAVAILHSGNGAPAPTAWARALENFSGFAVPFFLATSFYLAASKVYTNAKPYCLQSRLVRLLFPYAFWTAIYLLFAVLKYSVSGKMVKIPDLFHDPVSIIFFGGPGYHLYFIPLLLSGILLFKGAECLVWQGVSLKTLVLLSLLSTVTYEVVLTTENGFILGPNVAFQPLFAGFGLDIQQHSLFRVIGVAIAWMLRCGPYIGVALLLQHPSVQKRLPKWSAQSAAIAFLLFFCINGLGDRVLPASVYEVSRGYAALILAIALSTVFGESPLLRNLGLCSFGIYLMHLIWVETFKTLLGRIYPELLTEVTVLTLLTFSSLAWIFSWFLTALLVKRKDMLPKLLFGI
jgi:peptidoglycan/LPS O-acetylase OafA/YrhL